MRSFRSKPTAWTVLCSYIIRLRINMLCNWQKWPHTNNWTLKQMDWGGKGQGRHTQRQKTWTHCNLHKHTDALFHHLQNYIWTLKQKYKYQISRLCMAATPIQHLASSSWTFYNKYKILLIKLHVHTSELERILNIPKWNMFRQCTEQHVSETPRFWNNGLIKF